MQDRLDINDEFILSPYQNGMRLQRPDTACLSMGISIKDILQFPINVYFQKAGGIIQRCNEEVYHTHAMSSAGYASHHDLINVELNTICQPEYIARIQRNDKSVIQSKSTMIFEETISMLHEDIDIPGLSFKFPCYVPGYQSPIIFGLTMLLEKTSFAPSSAPLAEAMSILLKSGLLNNYLPLPTSNYHSLLPGSEIEGVYLSVQQRKCLALAAKGMTAKRIASELNISFRTVERHMENIKYKLNVNSKSELIEKVIDHFQKLHY